MAGMEVCESCGRKDRSVRKRVCAFSKLVHDIENEEQICDPCEGEHKAAAALATK